MEQNPTDNFYNSPIANPLANDSLRTKILKLVRHLNREKALKRGVKDVVKAIKKGSRGIVVLAADISPVDVISHIPVLCEDAHIPYVFVRSRLELGTADETKKPTSVVLMTATSNESLIEKYNHLHEKLKACNPYFKA